MKKKTRLTALCLALAMALFAFTGCGSGTADPGNYASQVAATIGDDVIYMDEANFFVRYNQWMMEPYYWSYYQYMGYSNMWDAPGSDNVDKTMATTLKQHVMDDLLQTRIAISHASEYGVTLDENDMDKVAKTVKDVMDNHPESFFNTYAKVNEEQLTKWFSNNALAVKVYGTVKDKANVNVSDEDCKMFTVRYLALPEDTGEGGMTTESGQVIDTAKAEAEYLVKHVREGEDFEKLVSQFESETTLRSYPVKDDERTDQAAIIGSALKKGEIEMGYKEEDKTWYVVYCVSEDDADAAAEQRKTLEEEQRTAHFESVYVGWVEKAPAFEIKDCYNDLVVSDGDMIYEENTGN